MAQEFASDNSKNGLFDRLKLSNHRGFFSFLFVSLSLILLLVTFAAVQQQQTTQSKAAINCNAGLNEPCGYLGNSNSLYSSCGPYMYCDSSKNLVCNLTNGTKGKCVSCKANGEACSVSGTKCCSGYCNGTACAASGTIPPLAGGQGPSVG